MRKPTKKEKTELEKVQEKIKSGKMKVVMAPQTKLNQINSDIYDCFLDIVLGHPEAWVSDMSYISSFCPGHTKLSLERYKKKIVKKTMKEMGVDISEVYEKPLVDILAYIQAHLDGTMEEE